MKHESRCDTLSVAPGLDLYHTGPNLDAGRLPAIFYFSLSGTDSLCLDPYNQPVQFLKDRPLRIFSLTLPAHEEGLSPHKALEVWADQMKQGIDPLDRFLTNAQRALAFAIDQHLVNPEQIGVAGLSRGALFASFLAAREETIRTILGYAPLTRLTKAKEFQTMQDNPIAARYDIGSLAPQLIKKRIRFYIGNRDTRVSTRSCFDCVEQLTEVAYADHIRSPQIELIIGPSIGQSGHGTTPGIFQQGAEWLASHL